MALAEMGLRVCTHPEYRERMSSTHTHTCSLLAWSLKMVVFIRLPQMTVCWHKLTHSHTHTHTHTLTDTDTKDMIFQRENLMEKQWPCSTEKYAFVLALHFLNMRHCHFLRH